MKRPRARPKVQVVLAATVAAVIAAIAFASWNIGRVNMQTASKIRAGMSQSELLDLMGGPPDDRAVVSGRITGLQGPGPGPPRWFTFQEWRTSEVTIAVYSDDAGAVVKCHAQPGPGWSLRWWAIQFLGRF